MDGPRQSTDGERDSTGSPAQRTKRKMSDSTDSETDEEEVDVQASLLAPRKSGGKDNAPASAASTTSGRRTTRSASPAKVEKRKAGPASKVKGATAANKKTSSAATKKKTAGKAAPAPKRTKKSKSTTASTAADDDSSEDEAGIRTVRSTSARGYSWEAEAIEMSPEDVENRLIVHDQIKAKIDRNGEQMKLKLKAGDRIFVLPDPSYLPPLSQEITIEELADDDWWVATVERTLSLPQEGQHDLGVLEIRWMYSKDDGLKLKDTEMHKSFVKQLREYRMDYDERIDSDHLDYIGIDSYGGAADGIYNYLELNGFEVKDVERMKKPHLRKNVPKGKAPLKRIFGFDRKRKAVAAGERSAGESDDEDEVAASPAKKSKKRKTAAKKKPSSTSSQTKKKTKPSSSSTRSKR